MALVEKQDRWHRLLVISWGLIGLFLLLGAGFWVLGKVSGALVPFVLGIVIVYMFRGPVAALESRGWSRGLATGVCYLVGLAIAAVIGLFVVPAVAEQLGQFFGDFPRYYDSVYSWFTDLQTRYAALSLPKWAADVFDQLETSISGQLMAWSSLLAKEAFTFGGQALGFLLNVFLAAVVGFWLLKDLPTIKAEAVLLAGPSRREEMSEVSERVSRVLSGYLRGQLIISAATAVIVAIGLAILGVPYALIIGLLAGILNIVPYVGPFVSEVIAAIAAAFVSPWLALAAVGVILVAQQVTDLFITPRVMSEQVDLHPLLVIFSLLAGAALFGVVGLLLAIPVAAIAKGVFVYYFEKYTDSKLSTRNGAFFRERKPQTAEQCDVDEGVPAEPAEEKERE